MLSGQDSGTVIGADMQASKVSGDQTGTTRLSNAPKKSINLLRGWPSISLLPAESLRAASQVALTDQSIWAPGLEYGPDPGYQPLREELARWLDAFYAGVVATEEAEAERQQEVEGGEKSEKSEPEPEAEAEGEGDRITITGGASQSLACLLQSFADPAPGRTLAVWIVAPCYFLACPILADAGFAGRLHAVPEDDAGVDLDVLEREICALEKAEAEAEAEVDEKRNRKGKGEEDDVAGGSGLRHQQQKQRQQYKDPGPHRKIFRHVIYCVPSFSNPSGRTMTLERRRGLVDLARRYDALVICDDVYDMLQWRVETFDDDDNTRSSPSSSSSSESYHRPQNGGGGERLNLDKAILPRLADIDISKGRSSFDPPGKHFGHVVSNGSFSKLVAPGVRTGWTYSTADLAFGMSQTGSTRSGGAASQLTATVVCQLLKQQTQKQSTATNGNDSDEEECELTRHINHVLRPAYARRHGLLLRSVAAELVPLGIRVREGSSIYGQQDDVYGGYFIWLKLPSSSSSFGALTPISTPTSVLSTSTSTSISTSSSRVWPTAKEIADRCRADEDLMIGNGELFAVHGDEDGVRFDDAIRLCFAWEDEADLVDGVQRLARVIRNMLREGPEHWRQPESLDTEALEQAK